MFFFYFLYSTVEFVLIKEFTHITHSQPPTPSFHTFAISKKEYFLHKYSHSHPAYNKHSCIGEKKFFFSRRIFFFSSSFAHFWDFWNFGGAGCWTGMWTSQTTSQAGKLEKFLLKFEKIRPEPKLTFLFLCKFFFNSTKLTIFYFHF